MNSLTIRDLNVLSNNERVLCTEISVDNEYFDGKPIKKIGTRFLCALEGNGYERVCIKTPELVPTFTMEDIEANGGKISVRVENFLGKVYVDRRSMSLQVSCRAAAVFPALEGGKDEDDDDEIII